MNNYTIAVYRKRLVTEYQEVVVAAPNANEAHQIAKETAKTNTNKWKPVLSIDEDEYETSIKQKGLPFGTTEKC